MGTNGITYTDRCQQIADAMHADGWPRLHNPAERSDANPYAMLYRSEINWRLAQGVDKGSPCPDQTGTMYETSWLMLRAHNDRTNGKTQCAS